MHAATASSAASLQFSPTVHGGMSQTTPALQCFSFNRFDSAFGTHLVFKWFKTLLENVWRSKPRPFPLRISQEGDFREAYLSAEALIAVVAAVVNHICPLAVSSGLIYTIQWGGGRVGGAMISCSHMCNCASPLIKCSYAFHAETRTLNECGYKAQWWECIGFVSSWGNTPPHLPPQRSDTQP